MMNITTHETKLLFNVDVAVYLWQCVIFFAHQTTLDDDDDDDIFFTWLCYVLLHFQSLFTKSCSFHRYPEILACA